MKNYVERIEEIAKAMTALDIPYRMREIWNGAQLLFPWCNGDVACHGGTYGVKSGMVETMGFPWDDDDVTALPVVEAMNKIASYFFKLNPNGVSD